MRLVFAAICVSMSAPAFAGSLLDVRTLLPKRAIARSECADFTGKWQGPCVRHITDNGVPSTESYNESVTLTQDGCGSLIVEGSANKYNFGGTFSSAETSAGGVTFSLSNFADWRADKKAFDVKFQIMAHFPDGDEWRSVTGSGSGAFQLAGDWLKMSSDVATTTTHQDGTKTDIVAQEACGLTRVPTAK